MWKFHTHINYIEILHIIYNIFIKSSAYKIISIYVYKYKYVNIFILIYRYKYMDMNI